MFSALWLAPLIPHNALQKNVIVLLLLDHKQKGVYAYLVLRGF